MQSQIQKLLQFGLSSMHGQGLLYQQNISEQSQNADPCAKRVQNVKTTAASMEPCVCLWTTWWYGDHPEQ